MASVNLPKIIVFAFSWKHLESYHLKKCQESVEGVVKVNVWFNPAVSPFKARGLVWHYRRVIFGTVRIHTLVEFPAKKVDAHNTEDQPEHHTDQENIGDTRDGMEQRTYHHLERKKTIILKTVTTTKNTGVARSYSRYPASSAWSN